MHENEIDSNTLLMIEVTDLPEPYNKQYEITKDFYLKCSDMGYCFYSDRLTKNEQVDIQLLMHQIDFQQLQNDFDELQKTDPINDGSWGSCFYLNKIYRVDFNHLRSNQNHSNFMKLYTMVQKICGGYDEDEEE